jgi:hypothetical protein
VSLRQGSNEAGDEVYVRRRFCGSCGSPIVSELSVPQGTVAIKAGTLDDKFDPAPTPIPRQAPRWAASMVAMSILRMSIIAA